MEFMLKPALAKPAKQINYKDGILLMGSCFTENIGERLQGLKFRMLQNPNGILYDPQSIMNALVSYMQKRQYAEEDIFNLNDRWQSWDHHSRFASGSATACLQSINESQRQANGFLKTAGWLIITLGTSFSYRLKETGKPVANCHKAPSAMFTRHLMSIDETVSVLDNTLHQLFFFNPGIRIIFTVSPVRHMRDGLLANSRSKARLIEAAQHLSDKFERIDYFPAYELVMDVLRDYRFFEADMLHPTAQAAQYVFEHFIEQYADEETRRMINDLQPVLQARQHRPFDPLTAKHQQFMRQQYENCVRLKQLYPELQLSEEMQYFGNIQQ